MKRIALAPIRAYQRWISPVPPPPLPLRADLLGLRGRVGRAVRRRSAASFSPPGACSAATPSATAASIRCRTASRCEASATSTRPIYHGEAHSVMFSRREHPAAADRRRQRGPQVLPRQRRPLLGHVDHRDHGLHPGAADPADLQTAQRHAGDAGAAAADQRDPGEIQKRQTAHAAGNDALLQREQSQPLCLLHSADGPAPGLHHPLLHAPPRAPERHLRQPGLAKAAKPRAKPRSSSSTT